MKEQKPSTESTNRRTGGIRSGRPWAGVLLALAVMFSANSVSAQLDLGADVVSRYVWRGVDFGSSAAVQPWIGYAAGNLEVGAWSSWSLSSPGANENDLYASYRVGDFGVTLTDYFFPALPGADGTYGFFEFDPDATGHIVEVLGSGAFGDFGVAAGVNVFGDDDNSIYIEGSYDFYEEGDVSSGLVVGLGNGVYTTDGEFAPVQVGLSASRGSYFASYVINPDMEVNWLYFGLSL
ncbi:MAG: hypothetical protein K9N46_11975 [Candidatus Marinimicrobia bacterium]|nr:hypothetical protein [Candidatus Neomarinimicrobiota bacterium]MCF7827753.1 hypothetical protein [Candidatus Neomarinimicrobiota bacterium]MCF7881447.1 hypothetical protein [Candidatus Neomarinimicrobiota bacterium]